MTMHELRRSLARVACLCAALAALAAVLAGRPASAQGVPAVPDPITVKDLVAYADIIDLSDSQRIALGPMLDEYMRQYAVLRRTEIQSFLDELMTTAEGMIQGGVRIPERSRLETIIEGYKRLLPRIESVDRGLFTQVQSICSDEQILVAERCKTLRALAIHDMLMEDPLEELNGAAAPRLTALVHDLRLDGETQASVNAILEPYERSMLGEVRRLHEVVEKFVVRILDVIDELGFREMDTAELMQYFQEESNQQALMQRFNEESKPMQAQLDRIARVNGQTFRRLLALLDAPAQERLRGAYFARAYSRAYEGPGAWRDRYERAAALDWLDGDRSALVTSERTRLVTADDALCDEIASVLDRARAYRTFDDLDNESETDAGRKWRELREDRRQLHAHADSRLESILGPEDYARFEGPSGKQTADGHVHAMTGATTTMVGADGTTVTMVVEETPRASVAEGLAGAMGTEDRDRLARALGLDESDALVVETLFEDYRATYATATEETVDTLEGTDSDEDPGKRDMRRREVTSAARDRLAALDAGFFESVAAIATDESAAAHVQRLRDVRRRASGRVSGRGFWSGQEGEAQVDIVRMLYDHLAMDEANEQVGAALDAYASEANRLVAERLEASDEMQRRMAMMERMRMRGDGSSAAQQQLAESMQQRWQQAITDVRKSDRALAAANRDALAQVLAALPEARRWPLEYAYRSTAYPDIYRPAAAIEESFTAVLSLPDLMPTQQERVAESLSGFRERFKTLSDEMIELRQARDQVDFSFMPNREMMERELSLERLRFERRELAERTRWELNLLLEPHQRSALGPGAASIMD